MTDILEIIQKTLDSSLFQYGVHSHWQRKATTPGENPDEYIVYTRRGDNGVLYADNKPLVKSADITLRYYYRKSLLDTNKGRKDVSAREGMILSAMNAAGFTCPYGAFDVGDVDGVGFMTTVFEFEYGRVV